MYQTIDFASFRDAFRAYDRINQFSREGLELIFDYIEDVNPDSELDVIAICCDYCEDTPESIAQSYNIDLIDCDPEDDQAVQAVVLDYLHDHTSVVGTTAGGIVYAAF